jgi:hypothetical protein
MSELSANTAVRAMEDADLPAARILWENTGGIGLSPEETIRGIEECNSWMVLKNVEIDPEYGALLDRCLAEVAACGGPPVREMREREAFVFVSSPGAMTPYHMDPEENFLLQVRGAKTIHVLPPDDRNVLSVEELEHFYGGAHRNLVFRERYRPLASAFELSPGWGVHVPVTSPFAALVSGYDAMPNDAVTRSACGGSESVVIRSSAIAPRMRSPTL